MRLEETPTPIQFIWVSKAISCPDSIIKNEGVISLPVEKSLLSLNKVPSSVWSRVHQQLLQSGWFRICTSMRLSDHILIQGYEIWKKASVLCFGLDVNIKKKKQESGHRFVKVDLRISNVKGIVSLMVIKHCVVQQGKHKRNTNEFVLWEHTLSFCSEC